MGKKLSYLLLESITIHKSYIKFMNKPNSPANLLAKWKHTVSSSVLEFGRQGMFETGKGKNE